MKMPTLLSPSRSSSPRSAARPLAQLAARSAFLLACAAALATAGTAVADDTTIVLPSPLVPAPTPANPGAPGAPGVPAEAPLSAEAQAVWDNQHLAVGDVLVLHDGKEANDAQLSISSQLYVGRYRRQISPIDFLHRTGRPDLAERMEARKWTRVGLAIAGGAVALGSFAYVAAQGLDGDPTIGLIGAMGGGGLLYAGIALGTDAPEAHQLRELADLHNRALRQRLSAPSAPPAGAASAPGSAPSASAPSNSSSASASSLAARLQLQVAPSVGPWGGGVSLMGRF